MQDIDIVLQLLLDKVCSPSHAEPPKAAGFYAWWCRREHLGEAVPAFPYEARMPVSGDWSLLYVGISPSGPKSSKNVAVRVAKTI